MLENNCRLTDYLEQAVTTDHFISQLSPERLTVYQADMVFQGFYQPASVHVYLKEEGPLIQNRRALFEERLHLKLAKKDDRADPKKDILFRAR